MTTTVNISQESLAEYERVYQVFDANGDGVVNILDAVYTINLVLSADTFSVSELQKMLKD